VDENDIRPSAGATPARLDAVLFDMDGVVTDTAQAHAAAWKRLFDEFLRSRDGETFQPFDLQHDYRKFVDGKPRQDGVTGFLRSRGIDLPAGAPDDPPDTMSVTGLARRKQAYFDAWLREHHVRTFPGTLKLIRDLHAAGIQAAVFSSSRNSEKVLRNAGALDLFDARVDGQDLASLELPGKPDPAMLLEAASRLGVQPGRTAIVEDAIAGVEAGARGGFALVIGVDRSGFDDALRRSGADVVVHDLAELQVSTDRGLAVKTLDSLPPLRDREAALRAELSGTEFAVFLDYDGTLAPIVDDPAKAFMSDDMRSAIAGLAAHCTVAIVSGRDLAMLEQLGGMDGICLVGSHGFEIAGIEGTSRPFEKGRDFLPELDAVERELCEQLAGIDGHSVERKRFSVAVHYRRVADADVDRLTSIVEDALAKHPTLRKGLGKKVLELRPDIDWHKGQAVLWVLDHLETSGQDPTPVYVGDDVTDEDAFRALSGTGLTVVVRDGESRQTAADYSVEGVTEVRRLLEMLTAIAADRRIT